MFKEQSFLCTEQSAIFGLVVIRLLLKTKEETESQTQESLLERLSSLSFRKAFNAWDDGKNFWPHSVFYIFFN